MNRTHSSRPFRLLALSSVAFVGFLSGPPAHAGFTPLLRQPEFYEIGGGTSELFAADFDLDGHKDLLMANGSTLTLLHHPAESVYPPCFQTPQASSLYPYGLLHEAVGDFNGDGRPDFAAVWLDSTNNAIGLGIWKSTSSGFVHVKDYFPTGISPGSLIRTGDLNQDGRSDLVVTVGSNMAILLAATPDSLGPPAYENVSAMGNTAPVVADATGDGVLDIVTTTWTLPAFGPPFYMWVLKGVGNGTFTHLGPFQYSGDLRAISTIVDNLNGDGIPDVGVETRVGSTVNHLQVFFGTGGGSFLAPTDVTLGASAGVVMSADMDKDGDVDLVTDGGAGLGVYRNNGSGGFSAAAIYTPLPPFQSSLLLTDVNEDGFPDWVAPSGAGLPAHTIVTFLNDGAGGFLASNLQAVSDLSDGIVLDDFNRDGRPDMASVEDSAPNVLVAAGNADGTFQPGTTIPIGSSVRSVTTGDMNRDGYDDLMVCSSNGLALLQGDGTGQFQMQGMLPDPVIGSAVGDMDRDGKPDIVSWDESTIRLYVQNGSDWSFTQGTSFFPGGSFTQLALGDWNRDGLTDIAIAGDFGIETILGNGTMNLTGGVNVVSIRKYTAFCVGDFNRDGVPDLAGRENTTGLGVQRGADVFLGNGTGGFTLTQSLGLLEPTGSALSTWDVNFDGVPDLIASGLPQLSTQYSSLDMLLGSSSGQFAFRSTYAIGVPHLTTQGAQVFAFGDVNLDGAVDVLMAKSGSIQTVLGTPPSFGTGMQSAATYSSLANPGSMALGDVNRDGLLDAVVSTVQASPGVAVSLGRAGGTLGTSVPLPQSWNASHVALADMNRDGKLDIVASNNGFGLQRVATLLGAGDGTFGAPINFFINAGNDFDIDDMDRDGIPDVVTADADSVTVLHGSGNGSLTPLARVGISPVYDLDVADLNRDGYLDVVCASGSVKVLYGGPGGTLSAPITLSAPLTTCQTVCVGDVNRDGFPDIIANDGGNHYVIRGGPVSPFSTYMATSLPFVSFDLQVGAAAGNGTPYVFALRNGLLDVLSVSQTGALTDVGSAVALSSPTSLALGDMNRDGVVDAVSVSFSSPSIAVNLHGQGTVTAVAEMPPAASAVEALEQNYPNPFNPETTIRYSLPVAERVRLDVYDVRGRWVARLADGSQTAGMHQVKWDGRTSRGTAGGSGVYFARLTTASGHSEAREMVLLK